MLTHLNLHTVVYLTTYVSCPSHSAKKLFCALNFSSIVAVDAFLLSVLNLMLLSSNNFFDLPGSTFILTLSSQLTFNIQPMSTRCHSFATYLDNKWIQNRTRMWGSTETVASGTWISLWDILGLISNHWQLLFDSNFFSSCCVIIRWKLKMHPLSNQLMRKQHWQYQKHWNIGHIYFFFTVLGSWVPNIA